MKKIANCVQCGAEFEQIRSSHKYCGSEKCASEGRIKNAIERSRKRCIGKEKYKDYVECVICGFQAPCLETHYKTHGISLTEYKEKYNEPTRSEVYHFKIVGENNPWYNHGGKMSPYSKQFVKYQDLTESEKEKEISEIAQKAMTTAVNNNNFPFYTSYYTSRGYTLNEAEIIMHNDRIFTLEKCIERHGPILGPIRWEERQTKWLATLDAKSEDEKNEINRKRQERPSAYLRRSTLNIDFEKMLIDNNIEFTNEFYIRRSADIRGRGFYYDIKIGNTLIELNGDFWHANPRLYRPKDKIKKIKTVVLAEDVWEYDYNKYQTAHNAGYNYCVIWEYDFRNNQEEVLRRILDELI